MALPASNTELLKSFFDSAPMMMGVADVEGSDIRHVSDNTVAARFFGKRTEELEGRLASELGMSKESIQNWVERYRNAEATGEPVRFEYVHSTPNESHILSVVVSFIGITAAGHSRFSYIVQDMTDVRTTEGELKEARLLLEQRVIERTAQLKGSEDRLRMALEAASMGVYERDLITGKVNWSEQAKTLLGHPSEIPDEDFESFQARIHPEDRKRFSEEAIHAATENRSVDLEYRYDHPDGRQRWLHAYGKVLRDERGTPVGTVGVLQDITQRKVTEAELSEAVTVTRNLADAIPHLVWMAEVDGALSWYNRRWYEYTGLTPKEMEGEGWQSVHHPAELPWVTEMWKKSIAAGEPFEMEFPLRSASGKFHWFLTRVEPVRDSSGKVVRWFGTNTYIDEQRELRKSLERAVRAREEFIGICSHELKTPITSMKLQFQMAEKAIQRGDSRVYSPEQVQRRVATANRQLDRMNHLIEEMLDVSRMGGGKLQLQVESVDLSEVVRDVLDRFSEQVSNLGIPVEVEIPRQELRLKGDRYRLEQVVSNLITNAIKYGNGTPIRITLNTDPAPEKVNLRVHDSGMGIPEGMLERIFGRFERAVSSTNVSGLGLGLYITRKIVEAHGGRIHVESVLGQGSTFVIEFPVSLTELRPMEFGSTARALDS